MKLYLITGLVAATLAWGALEGMEAREFTSSDGRKMEAEIAYVVGEALTLRRDGKKFNVPISRFSPADQKYILQWQEENKGKVPEYLKDKMPRLNMRISTGKTSKNDDQFSGFVDEHKQKVQLTATLKNEDAVYPIVDAKLTMLVLGTSPETGEDAVVYKTEFKGITLPLNEEKIFQGKGFELWYDDRGAMYGHKYKGYLVILEDPEGKVLGEATIPSAAAKYLDEAKKLNAGDIYGRDYRKKGSTSLSQSVKGL